MIRYSLSTVFGVAVILAVLLFAVNWQPQSRAAALPPQARVEDKDKDEACGKWSCGGHAAGLRDADEITDAGISTVVSTFRNEVAGERKYRGITYLHGFVVSVETDLLDGGATVLLSNAPGGWPRSTVLCHVDSENLQPLADINVGEVIWMQGDHATRIMGDVVFGHCQVVHVVDREKAADDVVEGSKPAEPADSAKPIRIGPGVTPPRPIYQPEPEFTEKARKANYQGICTLALVVGIDGRPSNIHVQSSLGMGLDEKAIEAVKTWKFEPAMKDGHPVAVSIAVEVDFHLY
jgi:TonB family protein